MASTKRPTPTTEQPSVRRAGRPARTRAELRAPVRSSAPAVTAASGETAPTAPAVTGSRQKAFGRWLFAWLRCLLVAWVYVAVLAAAGTAGTVAVLAVFVLPAIITTLYLPSARRRCWRWLVVWLIVNLVNSALFLPAALVATTWALHQFWVVERPSTAPRAPVVGPVVRGCAALIRHPLHHPLRGSLRRRVIRHRGGGA